MLLSAVQPLSIRLLFKQIRQIILADDVDSFSLQFFHRFRGIGNTHDHVGAVLFPRKERIGIFQVDAFSAQDIERFCLDSLTVEDTLDSIKSIDWAMFIPCGVRSYFAKPFYSAEGLQAVLIFASDTPGDKGMNEASFRQLYDQFAKMAMRWRLLKGNK
jgi:hypothetical protein